MTNAEMKTIYAKAGVAEADIEKIQKKYDFDKINEIIETANSPKDALESIHAFYPELEVAKMQEQMDFLQGQIEAAFKGEKTEIPLELTDEELEQVAGGGFYDWLGKNWRAVVGTAVGVVVGATAGAIMFSAAGPVGAVGGAVLCAVGFGATGLTWGHILDVKYNKEKSN